MPVRGLVVGMALAKPNAICNFIGCRKINETYGAPFRTKVFENQNSCRESDKTIREKKFMSKIGQNYLRIRIHVENIEQKYSKIRIHGENIEQKYSRIRIHGENRTEVFENQNSWP